MIGLFLRRLKAFICISIFIFIIPFKALPAEVLQVSSPSIIQIGDNNRNYKVKLACINIEPSKESEALNWMKSTLPRHSKVNLLPQRSEDGILLAELIKLRSNQDIAKSMSEMGFGEYYCRD
ncbi:MULTISPECIES: thermonuclease-like protein [Prochlorococcus]|uniref:Thermonuclease homolog n=1 Tax=Prochlorococcus marinus (strain SARG / CCMP1375 / SS120) TaxID=167539 RepID=Q7VD56_PROMA|nr:MULTISPECIES: thermonuclease-like protein [Prochlorococcus]AAP99572.1 Thermonuclease homolog [Prochlorococcus marinus subsp. marinus str. CCMP1375]KGG11156.1 hypothetical protein EV04_1230 [Prochlorococcus marinus str. LG]KGG21494.1 hypothetical protein EV08_0580 [Prochlorococcus marinus str. SS2]KGG23161.1 hypothetical protein EV09_1908 [Prochlorococcus marinus str. SS35]KGG33872.1 hypothetical protein EV10_0310 [Prochlorococcus marinus str. SS51]